MAISDRERTLRIKLKNDFQSYARACLKIRTKSGAIIPLELNKAQLHLHHIAEKQRAETGIVRIITVKGRQQGCSTLIEGRLYWLTTHRKGIKTFILTHEDPATQNLFEMARRYHDNCPPIMKPSTGINNANELNFDRLDSGYKIGTAGNKAVGRSSTVQLLHGSEVAYWPNAEAHASGLLQTVPREHGTEIWMESTANGPGDYFHRQWVEAKDGKNGFIPVFIPWFWQDEYTIEAPNDFSPATDERELIVLYGLTHGQLNWRRLKIAELGGAELGLMKFKREYPMNEDDAFEESADNKVIPIKLIRAAVNRPVGQTPGFRPIWGVDVGGDGATADRSALSKRCVNKLLEPTKFWQGKNTMQLVGLIRQEWDATNSTLRPGKICVDVIGMGKGVADRLKEYPDMQDIIEYVNVSETDSVSDVCARMRDELWWRARLWFEAKDVCIPHGCEALILELASPTYEPNSSGKVVIEGKKDMAKRGVRSPDLADSFNLTFAVPEVAYRIEQPNYQGQVKVAYDPFSRQHLAQDFGRLK